MLNATVPAYFFERYGLLIIHYTKKFDVYKLGPADWSLSRPQEGHKATKTSRKATKMPQRVRKILKEISKNHKKHYDSTKDTTLNTRY